MATSEAKKLAQDFLRDQAAIIRKYGHNPKMSGKKFQRVINETKRTFEALKAVSAKGNSRSSDLETMICPNCHRETRIDLYEQVLTSRKQCEICGRDFVIVNGVPKPEEEYAKS